MKGKSVLLLLAGILAGILLGAAILYAKSLLGQPGAAELPELKTGSPAPDFQLTGLDGQTGRLSDYRGRAVVINFWASWCAPCKNEMPLLQKYSQKYSPGLVVLGINSQESARIAGEFVKEMGVSFPVYLDESGKTGADYQVRGFPTTFFVDAQGVLRTLHIGELDEEQLTAYLAQIGVKP